MSNSNSSKLTLIPVMIAFFTMGFVDLVGAVSNKTSGCPTRQPTSSPRSSSSGSSSSPFLRAC